MRQRCLDNCTYEPGKVSILGERDRLALYRILRSGSSRVYISPEYTDSMLEQGHNVIIKQKTQDCVVVVKI